MKIIEIITILIIALNIEIFNKIFNLRFFHER